MILIVISGFGLGIRDLRGRRDTFGKVGGDAVPGFGLELVWGDESELGYWCGVYCIPLCWYRLMLLSGRLQGSAIQPYALSMTSAL